MKKYFYLNSKILQSWYLFYLALAYLIFQFAMTQFMRMPPDQIIDEIGILYLFNGLPMRLTALIIGSVLLVLLLVSNYLISFRWFRILVFVLFLLVEAFYNTNGLKTNIFLFWFWACFALCFCPSVRKNHDLKSFYYLVWTQWFQRSLVLLLYFQSGVWKTVGLVEQIYNNEAHALTRKGLSYHLASEMIRTGNRPVWTDFILQNTFFNTLMVLSVFVIQLGTIVFILRPKNYRIIGGLLMIFHIGSFFSLSITYPTNFLLVMILFLKSPEIEL